VEGYEYRATLDLVIQIADLTEEQIQKVEILKKNFSEAAFENTEREVME
jgi:hypothetical protein